MIRFLHKIIIILNKNMLFLSLLWIKYSWDICQHTITRVLLIKSCRYLNHWDSVQSTEKLCSSRMQCDIPMTWMLLCMHLISWACIPQNHFPCEKIYWDNSIPLLVLSCCTEFLKHWGWVRATQERFQALSFFLCPSKREKFLKVIF